MSFLTGNVYAQEMTDYQKKVLAGEQGRLDEKWKRRFYLVLAGFIVAIAIIATLAGAIRVMMPLKELLPLVLWRHDSGVIEAAVTPEALQVDARDGTLQSILYQYVMWRESYNSQALGLAHSIVDAMSAKPVGDAYDEWIGAHSNPKSYQNVYGDRCTVTVLQDASVPVIEWVPPGPNGTTPGRYSFRFWKTIACRGETQQPATEWIASLTFIAGYRGSDLNFWITKMFNASRVVVVDYAPPRPVQAVSKDVTR